MIEFPDLNKVLTIRALRRQHYFKKLREQIDKLKLVKTVQSGEKLTIGDIVKIEKMKSTL